MQSDGPPKRISRACDSCYRRKIKCDAAVPQCNWCSHHNLACTFDRVVQRKRKADDDHSKPSELSDRIDRIEQLLTENLMQNPDLNSRLGKVSDGVATTAASPSASMSSQPIMSSMVGVHFAGRELGVISLLTGIPFLLPEGQEWIQARTGQSISSDKLSPTRAPWETERGDNTNHLLENLQSPDFLELPDWRQVRLYFEAFKDCAVMRRLFPVVDFDLFEETILAAYHQPKSIRYGQARIRACVIIFLAFTARIPLVQDKVKGSPFVVLDHDALAAKGEFLLGQVLQEPASIEAVQALTMLALYQLTAGNMRLTNYFGAVAARLLFMVGANLTSSRVVQESEHSEKKQKLLRNLFWLCYTIDKDVALRTGQPPTIADENCDLTLPPGYLDRAFIDPHTDLETGYEPIFPFDLRLSIIKSRAHSSLYSVHALNKSDADLLKSIRELDDELEDWRLSVPAHCRPTMSFAPESTDPNISMHRVMLRLNYYLCMTIIHQASSRCKAWMQGSGMMDGVSSSLALSVEASRSTLCYLEAAEHVLVDGVFWTLIFYPMSALLTIFFSILQNPLDPRSRDDMERLSMATKMMKRVFSRKLPENEVVHFQLVSDFVLELKRLAECAIEKAWYEQNAGMDRH